MDINIVENVNDINSPFLGLILILLIVFPEIIVKLMPKKGKKAKNVNLTLEIIKYVLLAVVGLFMALNRNYADIAKANFMFGFSTMWYILYIEIFAKYLLQGMAERVMYKPFMKIQVPAHFFSSMALVCINLWAKHYILAILAAIYGIINVYSAYKLFMANFTEYRELYDEDRKKVGKKILKDEKPPKGLRYITVAVLIYSPKKKKYLMQKRTKDKGGLWATTAGHPKEGESSIEGMMTEIKEELGLDIKENELKCVDTIKRKKMFVDVYYLEKDIEIEDCTIQEEELTDLLYMSEKEVKKFYEVGKFKESHYKYFLQLLDKIK